MNDEVERTGKIATIEDIQAMLGHSSTAVTRIYLEHIGEREEARSELLKHPTDHDIATGKVRWVDQPYPHLVPGE